MSSVGEFITRGVLIGVGGSALTDVWALVARRAFGMRGLDYGLLGRWIGHFPRGRFVHERIGAADPVRGEWLLGRAAHYSIGVAFALLLLAVWGLDWARSPAILPPMLVGLGSVVAPWFVLQPGMGSSVAASRTASGSTRRRSCSRSSGPEPRNHPGESPDVGMRTHHIPAHLVMEPGNDGPAGEPPYSVPAQGAP